MLSWPRKDPLKSSSIILPNIGGASEPKRILLASVVESILLYAAPFWIESASTKAIEKLEAIHRIPGLLHRITSGGVLQDFVVRSIGGHSLHSPSSPTSRGATDHTWRVNERKRTRSYASKMAKEVGSSMLGKMDV